MGFVRNALSAKSGRTSKSKHTERYGSPDCALSERPEILFKSQSRDDY